MRKRLKINVSIQNQCITLNCKHPLGEQAHFIGVNFVLVFSRQLCSKNGAILPRAGNEDYRPGKGVKDMLAFILQTAVQSAAQYIFHTLDNKIDDFHRHIAI